MTYHQALEALLGLRRFGVRPSLDGMLRALDVLGHPERAFSVVHIAGTNGKGSTAAFCAALLGAANCRTGLYTSPHLCRFTERIRIDNQEVSGEEIAEWTERLLPLDLTFFELATAMAFALFRARGVEVAVVEAGMGGRWDATNVVRPLVTVVTGVALDHMEVLGDSLEAIAREKAGIFKPGIPAVAACRDERAQKVLIDEAARVGARLSLLGRDFAPFRGPLGLLGAHQADNAALALEAVLHRVFPVAQALAETRWPGRLEWLTPEILVDAAHNPEGASALAAALPSLFAGPFTLVVGLLDDKDAPGILGPLLPLAARVILTRPRSPRALDPAQLPAQGEITQSLSEALSLVRGPTLICGSVFLVGEARHLLLGEPMDPILAQDPAAQKL